MTSRPVSRRRFVPRACALAIVAALGATGATTAHAENVMDAYRQALQSDPVLKQAEAQNRIGNEGVVQSRAVLLPQIGVSGGFSDSHGSSTSNQPVNTGTGFQSVITRSSSSTRSFNKQATLNQVLFDLGDFARLRASKSSAEATAAQYAAAEQDLILRVAQAYFTVLTDEKNLKFAEANEKALQKQLDQAQAKYDVGFAAITDVVDAKAQHDNAIANVINAKNQVFNDRQALAQITGQPAGTLETLTDNLPLTPPQPDDMATWVKTALANNPSLEAQRDNVDAAQHDITAARAGHLPTLNAQVIYSNTPAWGNQTGTNLPGDVRFHSGRFNTTVGLVLNVPLFSGGAVSSRVRQSIAQRDQTNDVLEQNRRTVVSNTRSAFNAIEAGVSSVEAQKQAVVSAKTALDATQAGYQIGTRTIVDLLLSQQTYFQAQSSYSQARHALVVNRLNLEFSAGTLSVKELQAVNALLQ